MKSIKTANDQYLFCRLNEIEDDLKDFFISDYKTNILTEEKNLIIEELKKRNYTF